jgi:hypothetical protein
MPSTKKLVDRLKDESRYFVRLALVVSYPGESLFIWNDCHDPLRELERHVEAGGIPFALMGYVARSGGYGFQTTGRIRIGSEVQGKTRQIAGRHQATAGGGGLYDKTRSRLSTALKSPLRPPRISGLLLTKLWNWTDDRVHVQKACCSSARHWLGKPFGIRRCRGSRPGFQSKRPFQLFAEHES